MITPFHVIGSKLWNKKNRIEDCFEENRIEDFFEENRIED
jgi:hypothetical protein